MAQSSLSQGTRSAGISEEITCTVFANGEQDLRMPKVHRASNAAVRAPRHRKRAAGIDSQTQSRRSDRPRTQDHAFPNINTRPSASRSSIRSTLFAPAASSLRVLLREPHLLSRPSPWALVSVPTSHIILPPGHDLYDRLCHCQEEQAATVGKLKNKNNKQQPCSGLSSDMQNTCYGDN